MENVELVALEGVAPVRGHLDAYPGPVPGNQIQGLNAAIIISELVSIDLTEHPERSPSVGTMRLTPPRRTPQKLGPLRKSRPKAARILKSRGRLPKTNQRFVHGCYRHYHLDTNVSDRKRRVHCVNVVLC